MKVPFALSDEQAVTGLIADCRKQAAGRPVSLVVFDSAADFYGADDSEISATDMQRLLAACKRISRELGCFVLLIGHTGHGEQERMRGTSRFYQVWDFEAQSSRDDARPLCGWLRFTKEREEGLSAAIPFHLAKTAEGSLAVRPGHPQPGEDEETALPEFTGTEQRVWREVAAFVRAKGSGDRPLSFKRIKLGVTGREETIRKQLDALVAWHVIGTMTTAQGHEAYFAFDGEWPEMIAAAGRPY